MKYVAAAVVFVGILFSIAVIGYSAKQEKKIDDNLLHCYVIAQTCMDAMDVLTEKGTPNDTMLVMGLCSYEWQKQGCPKLLNDYRRRKQGRDL